MPPDSDPSPDEAQLPTIGWREWIVLPELGIERVKAKIDTGARSCSLHAFDIEPFQRNGQPFVRFRVHPEQRSERTTIECEAAVHDIRNVRSSSGESTQRYVIRTAVRWQSKTWTVEITLADRQQMGFRMLLGREAMRHRVQVDPARSFLGGRLKRTKRPGQRTD